MTTTLGQMRARTLINDDLFGLLCHKIVVEDIGWHIFILYTREYALFCDNVAGRLIHDVPQDAPDAPDHAKVPVSVRDTTVDTIRRAAPTLRSMRTDTSLVQFDDPLADGYVQ